MADNTIDQKKVSPGFCRFDTRLADLRQKSVKGLVFSLSEGFVNYGLKLIATMVLARYVAPQDQGIMAMLVTVIAFLDLFKDLGLNTVTISREVINHQQISNLFWVNLVVGLLIGAGLAVGSPLLAWFYQENRLIAISMMMSAVYPLAALSVQHQALLYRQMNYFRIALARISGTLAGTLAGIIMAYYHWGYWSLVWLQIVSTLTTSLLIIILCGWLPGWPRRQAGTEGFLRFGRNLTLFNLLDYCCRNMDNILIGRLRGSLELGFYSKAYSLLTLPIGQITHPITSVAVPALSRLQDRPDEYAAYYYRAVTFIAMLTMPAVALAGALAEEVVWLILGEEWLPSAPLFRILALAAIVQPVLVPTGWIYVTLGQTRRLLLWGIFSTALFMLAFAIGIHWGSRGVAWSYIICNTLQIVPLLLFTFKYSPVRFSAWLNHMWPWLLLSIAVYFQAWYIHYQLYGNRLIILLASMAGSILAAGTAVSFSSRMQAELKWIGQQIQQYKQAAGPDQSSLEASPDHP